MTDWKTIRDAIGVVKGAPADAVSGTDALHDDSTAFGFHEYVGDRSIAASLVPGTREWNKKTKRALKLIDKQLEGEPVYTRPAPEDFRCFNCRSEPTCPSAWDLYNTGGDCLEEK